MTLFLNVILSTLLVSTTPLFLLVNTAIGILATNGKNLISKFLVQLNAEERNNFMKNGTNKKEWIKKWLRNKHNYNNERIANRIATYNTRTTFNKYVNSLSKLMNAASCPTQIPPPPSSRRK